MPDINPEVRQLLFGTPFGEVYPPKPNPAPLSVDGRTVALRLLAKYVAGITFYRPMAKGQPPDPFRIPEDRFLLEWPDNPQDVRFPCAVVVPGKVDYDVIGLTAYVEESTRDRYGVGTVLQWQSEYTEVLFVEFWASENPVRRSIAAGFEPALSPTEQMSGLRFSMPDYFDELVCFTLNGRQNIDDTMSGQRRKRVRFEIEMRFNVVALVNYVPFQPTMKTTVDTDEDTNEDVPLEEILGDENAEGLGPEE